jgi:peptidoglycan hydrolase CwlO-like protein
MLRRSRAISFVALILLVATRQAGAQTNGKSATSQGGTPNGKPFVQIQSQFTQVQQEIQALQSQIDSVETALQTEIAHIYDSIGQLQGQVDTLADATAALRQRVTDNEGVISALNSAAAALQAKLDSALAQLAAANGNLQALTNQVSSLQTLITLHQSQILALQSENASIDQFLTNLAKGTCQSGQAINAIGATGLIACSQAGTSSGGVLTSYTTHVIGYMTPNSPTSMNVVCQPGYIVTGGGYLRPYFNESVPYVSSLTVTPVNQWFYNGSTWNYQFTGHAVQSSYGYLQRDPISVLAARTTGSAYHVQFFYAPQVYTSSPSFEAWATCVKSQ